MLLKRMGGTLKRSVPGAEKPAIGVAGWQTCRLTTKFREKHRGSRARRRGPGPHARSREPNLDAITQTTRRDRQADRQPALGVVSAVSRPVTFLRKWRPRCVATSANRPLLPK